jgi:adenylate kinase family enzyme
MDTSVTIIGLFITLLIGIPLFYAMKSNSINNNKIKEIKNKFSQNNCLKFELTETLNKKVLALDKKNRGFLFIDFNSKEEVATFVDLNEVHSCKLVLTTENNSDTIVKIEFEFQYKKNKKTEFIPFYKIENDQMNQVCLYEDHQLAKKWREIIQDCTSF